MRRKAANLRKPTLPRIALFLDRTSRSFPQILRGLLDYMLPQGGWRPVAECFGDIRQHHLTRAAGVDGIIAEVGNRLDLARAIRRTGLPAVNITPCVQKVGLPQVIPDHTADGALVAQHFLQRGYRHFGYCGSPLWDVSDERFAGFQATLAASHRQASQHQLVGARWGDFSRHFEDRGTIRWLRQLPRPVAIMACTDVMGRHLILNAQRIGLRIPDDLAIVAVDNDEALCAMLTPPLSSVEHDHRRIGYQAAAMLSALIARRKPDARLLRIPPLRLVCRLSSDALAITDADVALAASYIRQHADQPISVGDVLDQVSISRRALEVRFRRELGRTPQKEIWRVRVERARQLLSDTDWKMSRIAATCGFYSAELFSVVFRRETGQSPTAYREHHQYRHPPG